MGTDENVAKETNQAVDLTGADLSDTNVTKEQLDNYRSFSEATMPNGQKYENRLKSKDRGEDEENGGPSHP